MKMLGVCLGSLWCILCAFLISSCGSSLSDGPTGTDPPTFTSSNGVLDLLVVAEPKTITLGPFQPTAWVFAICEIAVAEGDNCPDDSRTASNYGGVRLQLYPGDHLRMKLVNHLPPVPSDAKYVYGSLATMGPMLTANPVNIHTHGLIVEPRKADATDPTYGDYVYVLEYPSGHMPSMVDPDITATDQPIQYDIYIPPNHPPGIYWFHPHVHGLSINQLSEGLSGIITIGKVTDYLNPPAGMSTIPTRYMVLKDMQVLNTGAAMDQESALFCSPYPVVEGTENGFCAGFDSVGIPDSRTGKIHTEDEGPGEYEGGAWYFTVNGQVFPQIPMPKAPGELWRFLNAGASRSYDLVLLDDQTGNRIPFQVVSLDGTALAPPVGAAGEEVRRETAGKVNPMPCPAQSSATASTSQPVCATDLVMFPGARAEIWVLPQAGPFTLQTLMLYTGPAGDRWPEVTLAHIVPNQTTSTAGALLLSMKAVPKAMLSPQGVLGAPVRASFAGISPSLKLQDVRQLLHGTYHGSALHLNARQLATVETRMKEMSKPEASAASPACSALPAGHRRRIFFGIPSSNPNAFGLGYEEVDENDNPVPGTFQDVTAYDPDVVNICLPLGPNNTPVTETWELVNLAAEAHNFHIHQTKFYVLPQNAPPGDAGAMMDNVVLPNGGASCDGSVATWRVGNCPVQTVTVQIPFAEVGDFVYHCHIGEHQDGGMMAHIRVIASE